MTVRSYTSEAEWQTAQAEAMAEFRRTGLYSPPRPAALVAHEAVRHHRSAFGVGRPAAPQAAPAAGVTGELLTAVAREATRCSTDAAAQSLVARQLREAGATDDQVTGTMRRVQDQRDTQRDPGW